ncbi:hypothetical protein N7532_000077 [Penicillium argentinense]|uniref:Zn(2)-C6 fungal-type domain-containing protein n=1 Tax=Penicillium argentinense TaxID=1131581 RepID=A0A9W9G4U8_9EURO|nr:uncharacterized protein N7532_000077 [Penicillium argentinense]KAJ5112032.1 hypothetical protein N7532_000077 [Penicillium argentinense]
MNPVTQDEADRVLRQKARKYESHACYPCRKRKVKCDGSQPCRTCIRREHPGICSFQTQTPRRERGRGPSTPLSVRTPASASARVTRQGHTNPIGNAAGDWRIADAGVSSGADNSEPRPDDASKDYVYSGDNSVVSILRLRGLNANDSVAREVGSVLGLQNTFSSYPFMDSKTPGERWRSLLGVLPQRAEVLKFFHYYRITAYPFNPILADMDRFELDLCTYLNAHAGGDLRNPECISERWATDKSVGHISLLLATLAAGAHYSDIEYPQRLELSTDFARRSFHALRLANFLFRPSLDIIQALLVLGNTLQNMGQSDAAWALLGTTVRLAQTMGLHTERGSAHWPEYVRSKAKALWSTIVWQDSLLCLCYDRAPIVSVSGWPSGPSFFERTNLSYADTMHYLCRLGLIIMCPQGYGVTEADRAIETLQNMDALHQRGQPHLLDRGNCATMQQHLEHLALKMHTSFCVSVICRPAMKQSQTQLPHMEILRSRAKGSLIDASRAFLDFEALSVVPLRSWSMVHTVLSSTLLLCIWEETRSDPECRDLQQRVIDVFSSSDSRSDDRTVLNETDGQWLSERHIRALVTLRSALDREEDRGVVDSEQLDTRLGAVPPFNAGDLDGDFDLSNPFDISPVTYLDSIMNVPIFDMTQEYGFP